MKYILYISILLSIMCIYALEIPQHKKSNHVKLAEKVSAKAGKEIEKAFKIKLIGSGGKLMFRIDALRLDFGVYRVIRLEEARKMVVESSKIFLNTINASEEIRPYLCNYPFKIDEITVNFHVFSRTDDSLSFFYACEGEVCYYKRDPISKKLTLVHEEPYEDAIRVLQKQENDTLNEI